MYNEPTTTEEVLKLARQMGVLRVRDLTSRGIHPEYLRRLCQKGLLTRTGRGLYVAADAEVSVHHDLAQACKRVSHGVICLLSALQFHELGTQSPLELWMALDRRAARPRMDYSPLRFVRFSGKALAEGIEEHTIEGVRVRIYNPAKTVADCFKYRNKIGLDVALEALRDCREQKKCSNDDLWRYAKICRVANVMRPYLEATSGFRPVAGETGGRYTTKTMTRDDGEAFKARWAMVNTAERDELRTTSMDKKLRQLAALMASVEKLGWDEALAAEEIQAREQWRRLRQAYGI